MNQRPFKKFYCDQDEIFRLPQAAFKIWMYHFQREGIQNESWPSKPTISAKLGIHQDTVKKWRQWLIKHGWLTRSGYKLTPKGAMPIFQTAIGTIPQKEAGKVGVNDPQVDKPLVGVNSPQVDSDPQVVGAIDPEGVGVIYPPKSESSEVESSNKSHIIHNNTDSLFIDSKVLMDAYTPNSIDACNADSGDQPHAMSLTELMATTDFGQPHNCLYPDCNKMVEGGFRSCCLNHLPEHCEYCDEYFWSHESHDCQARTKAMSARATWLAENGGS